MFPFFKQSFDDKELKTRLVRASCEITKANFYCFEIEKFGAIVDSSLYISIN